jgi:uncharacterized membrane protein
MNAVIYYGIVSILLVIIDIPWLWLNAGTFQKVVKDIQGSPLRFRLEGALVVYPALAYLVLKAKTVQEAFMIGAATYAVYDFTTYAAFSKYPIHVAIMDTLWGGTLFAITHLILQKFD